MSQSWYGLYLGNSTMAAKPLLAFTQAFFNALRLDAVGIDGKAMLMHATEVDANGEDEITLYFSPQASEFVLSIPGVGPCEAPVNDGRLVLLGGDGAVLLALKNE